jgi:hypothetical protein
MTGSQGQFYTYSFIERGHLRRTSFAGWRAPSAHRGALGRTIRRTKKGEIYLTNPRSWHGTYISVEPFHLFRYIDEQAFRFNNRKMTDAERLDIGVREIVGKRLTYEELIGQTRETETIH